MKFDPNRAIYIQIMEEIKKRAARGVYAPGSQIPSVREMALEMGVNPNTIVRVFMELEREGFIETRRGQGAYISPVPGVIEKERAKIAENAAKTFTAEIESLGLGEKELVEILENMRKKLTDSR